MSNEDKKVILEAKLVLNELSDALRKEVASRIPIPSDNPQDDLLLMSAILVSTGTNKNGATFLGSELVKAKDSIADKALDVEHKQDIIIGHIKSALFLDQEGAIIDVNTLHASLETASSDDKPKLEAAMDAMDMDIGIVCVVHKHRFQDLAEEIKNGEWHVSMECYYKDFDLMVGDIIIPKEQATKMNFDLSTNRLVNLVVSGQSLGNHKVSRVLRGIKFCGVGIVKHPANERSVIDETAGQILINDEVSEIMASCYREAAGVIGTLQINSPESVKRSPFSKEDSKEILLTNATSDSHGFAVVASQKIQGDGSFVTAIGESAEGKDIVKYGNQLFSALKSSTRELAAALAVKATRLTGITHYVTEVIAEASVNESKIFSEEELDKGFTLLTTDSRGDILKQIETSNFAFVGQGRGGGKWGAADNAAGTCISFAKYHYEFDRSPNPGKLVATHWCKLFNQACPVLGADATARECLRNKYSRLIKDDSYHFNAVREATWNPRSTTPKDEVVFLPAEEQPLPPADSGDSSANEKYGERLIPGPMELDDSFSKPPLTDVTFDDGHPNTKAIKAPKGEDLIVTEQVSKFKPGIEELTSLFSQAASRVEKAKKKIFTKEELSALDISNFAFPEKRELPIHTPEAVEAAMGVICKKISSERSLKENGNPLKYIHPHARVLAKAYIYGLDTRNFEHVLLYEEGEGDNYGLPRLKLFPLGSRNSVIAAISRFDKIKQDITEEERNMLFVKIVKAASSFNVDVEKFVSKFRNRE